MLIGFFDISRYMMYCKGKDDLFIYQLMAGFFELTGGLVEGAGGYLVKCIGDAGLAVFPAELADRGVMTFLEVKKQGDAYLAGQGVPGKIMVKMHLGSVTCGKIGVGDRKLFDVYGKNVNTTATLPSNGVSITPQAFRALEPDTRKRFKKHTPPITYISINEVHL
jgi:adenylate cyclase